MLKKHSSGTLLCPITAVTLLDHWVVAARGSSLVLLDIHDSSVISHQRVFSFRSISGVAHTQTEDGTSFLLLWGGRSARFASIDISAKDSRHVAGVGAPRLNHCATDQILHFLSPEVVVDDRILCAQLAPRLERKASPRLLGIFVTAHNALYSLSCSLEQDQPVKSWTSSLPQPRLLVSGGHSLLFCARLKWLTPNELIVASGTAFGELIVLVTRFAENETEPLSHSPYRYNAAHEDGALFGLDIFYRRNDRNSKGLYVVTCSDDRTIRLWDVSAALYTPGEAWHSNRSATRVIGKIAWTWAHISRIWNVLFILQSHRSADCDEFSLLVSTGEDAASHLWYLHPLLVSSAERYGTYAISHVCKIAQHAGKNCWIAAARSSYSGFFDIITGGADGALEVTRTKLLDYFQNASQINPHDDSLTVIQCPVDVNANRAKPRSFCWLNANILLVITIQAEIWQRELVPKIGNQSAWIKLGQYDTLNKFSVVKAGQREGSAFLGASDGTVLFYDAPRRTLRKLAQLPGKIISLMISRASDLNRNTNTSDFGDLTAILICSLKQSEATLFLLDLDTTGEVVLGRAGFKLPHNQSAALTSMLAVRRDSEKFFVFIGNRTGHILRYQIHVPKRGLQGQSESSHGCPKQIHDDAITSITLLGPRNEDSHRCYLLTTARDFSYKITSFAFGSDQCDMFPVHQASPPFGPLIEGAMINRLNQHLVLYGFRGNEFVVYDATAHRELASVNCKGGHRLWCYCHSDDSGDSNSVGALAWSTGGELHAVALQRSDQRTLLSGGHGREIKSCAVRPTIDSGNGHYLIATGAEDTDIRLFEHFAEDPGLTASFCCINIIKKHNTGIQQLSWSPCGRYLFSCGGSEEFFVWRISAAPVVEIGVCLEAQIDRLDPDAPELRITGFDVLMIDGQNEGAKHLIATALSDSTARLYSYSASEKSMTLVFQGRHTTCCLTQICLWAESGAYTILATATDGRLIQWPRVAVPGVGGSQGISAPIAPTHTKFIHQNAIKALSVVLLPCTCVPQPQRLAVTTGDDNAIGFTLLGSSTADTHSLRVPRAHAASITAVAVVAGPSTLSTRAGEKQCWLRVVTSGNDMTVRTWDVFIPEAEECGYAIADADVVRVGKMRTQIADVGDLRVLDGSETTEGWKKLLVVGVGMEIVSVCAGMPERVA